MSALSTNIHSLSRLQAALSPLLDAAGLVPGARAEPRYCQDWNGQRGEPLAVLRPRTPQEVAQVMRHLHALAQPVVIQGGMTGLVAGGVPQPGEVVLSMERLNTIESFDTQQGTLTVQAGVPLETVHQHVQAQGWMFPVDIGSRGSCQIGGLIATNAGGNRVLRYGMTRQSILGLEAVLADGSVISRMGAALKDNAGYDLKQNFIGSEGTLGIVTRARLGLVPLSNSRHTAVVALQTFAQVQALLSLCRNSLGGQLSSFEVMWRDYFTLATQVIHAERPLFSQPAEFWVLIETMGTDIAQDMALLEQTLAQVLAWDDAVDVVLAQSLADAQRLWAVREAAGEAARAVAPWAGFDVSMPTAEMPGWADAIRRETMALGVPQTQTYGHLGDGNLHLVVGPIPAQAGLKEDLVRRVHASVGALGGSISGEHGIGFSKKSHLGMTRSVEEIALMRTLKHALDPLNLLNRGRIFDMP